MNYTYTKETMREGSWIRYLLHITGWETAYGEAFTEVHFTMPKSFDGKYSDKDMASCPHITMVNKSGWTYHRYEKAGRKYPEAQRLVKKGKTAYSSAVYPATSNENNIVKLIAADIGTLGRP